MTKCLGYFYFHRKQNALRTVDTLAGGLHTRVEKIVFLEVLVGCIEVLIGSNF